MLSFQQNNFSAWGRQLSHVKAADPDEICKDFYPLEFTLQFKYLTSMIFEASNSSVFAN